MNEFLPEIYGKKKKGAGDFWALGRECLVSFRRQWQDVWWKATDWLKYSHFPGEETEARQLVQGHKVCGI